MCRAFPTGKEKRNSIDKPNGLWVLRFYMETISYTFFRYLEIRDFGSWFSPGMLFLQIFLKSAGFSLYFLKS